MAADIIKDDENLSPEEKKYNDYMRRGDDFYRIELFKSAKEMYLEALKYLPEDDNAKTKADDCRRLIKRDMKRILVILPILIILVMLVICAKMK